MPCEQAVAGLMALPPARGPSSVRSQSVAKDQPCKRQCQTWESTVLVLSTGGDTREEILRCGEVLSTVLLECTVAGMATCTLTHLIELPEGRDFVRAVVGEGHEPHVLIRVGMAPPMENLPAATPRLPLDDILVIR